jgi:outer membrane protein OmpA-like peptidoglycan-associated protein
MQVTQGEGALFWHRTRSSDTATGPKSGGWPSPRFKPSRQLISLAVLYVTKITFTSVEPVVWSKHPNAIRRNSEDTTMTSFHRFSVLKTITFTAAALSMTAGLALAGDNVSASQIVNALQPKPLTRGLSVGEQQPDPAIKAKEIKFVNTLRGRHTRSLSMGEREEIAEIASSKPKIDLDIQFDYNSADISKSSMSAVQELGKALSNASLKGSTFVVAGHTDAVGGESYNQGLSERRADTIKKYLTEKYGINGTDLVTVGYGKTKPKDPNAPMDPVNRRVQVVNMDTKTASQ